jgi:hypothetical protein
MPPAQTKVDDMSSALRRPSLLRLCRPGTAIENYKTHEFECTIFPTASSRYGRLHRLQGTSASPLSMLARLPLLTLSGPIQLHLPTLLALRLFCAMQPLGQHRGGGGGGRGEASARPRIDGGVVNTRFPGGGQAGERG